MPVTRPSSPRQNQPWWTSSVSAPRATAWSIRVSWPSPRHQRSSPRRATFHLQPIWAIILVAPRLEHLVEIAHQDLHVSSSSLRLRFFHAQRLWLILAQSVTVCLAVLFVVSTLKPEWLGRNPTASTSIVALQESPAPAEPQGRSPLPTATRPVRHCLRWSSASPQEDLPPRHPWSTTRSSATSSATAWSPKRSENPGWAPALSSLPTAMY